MGDLESKEYYSEHLAKLYPGRFETYYTDHELITKFGLKIEMPSIKKDTNTNKSSINILNHTRSEFRSIITNIIRIYTLFYITTDIHNKILQENLNKNMFFTEYKQFISQQLQDIKKSRTITNLKIITELLLDKEITNITKFSIIPNKTTNSLFIEINKEFKFSYDIDSHYYNCKCCRKYSLKFVLKLLNNFIFKKANTKITYNDLYGLIYDYMHEYCFIHINVIHIMLFIKISKLKDITEFIEYKGLFPFTHGSNDLNRLYTYGHFSVSIIYPLSICFEVNDKMYDMNNIIFDTPRLYNGIKYNINFLQNK